jgi:hypothetical protein
MNLGIVGSRKLVGSVNAYKIIQDYITAFKPDKIVSGGAVGVDSMAAEVALALGYIEEETLIIHLPQPKEDSRAAYIRACFERNGWIVRDSTHVLAVTVPGGSNGTRDTIKKAIDAGKTIYVQETI